MASARAFDFTAAMCRLCDDITHRMRDFSHIQMSRVAVSFAQTRSRVTHGLQAKLTPMRFEGGELITRRHGRDWAIERLFRDDQEMLYILTFYMPRFQDQTFREKMLTVFHELYHVSPRFNGDIRRLGGRYHVHSQSCEMFDRVAERYAERYLSLNPPKELYQFLRHRFRTLDAKHGRVVGLQVPIPKVVPLDSTKSA